MNAQIQEVAPCLQRYFNLARCVCVHRTGSFRGKNSGAILIVILLLLGLVGRSTAASISWTNIAGGAWTNAVNWNPNQVPGAADIAWITNANS